MKEQFKELIDLESEISNLQNQIQTMRKRKKSVEETIKEYIENENLTDKTFVVSNKKIKYNEHKIYQSYSLQYLEESLLMLLKDKKLVSSIILYLKENRKTTLNKEIKIFDYNNE